MNLIIALLRKLPKRHACSAYAQTAKNQCTKKALWGTKYCWQHESKFYPCVSAILSIMAFVWTTFIKDRVAPSQELRELRLKAREQAENLIGMTDGGNSVPQLAFLQNPTSSNSLDV